MGKFAVVGNPIEHSLSPEIHLAFGRQTGITLSYEKRLAESDAFSENATEFFKNGGSGLNVTAPFKGDAFNFCSSCDTAATASGAVNTIHATGDGYRGFNTDGIGLINDLKRLQWLDQAERILVLGAGGAAQGILPPLLETGKSITLANRTEARAEALRSRFQSVEACGFDALTGGWDLVINATAAGWDHKKLPLSRRVFKDAYCYDLGYQADGQTMFVTQVESEAAIASDGLGMLVEQAAMAFHIWHSVSPETMPVLEGLRKRKQRFIAGAVCPRCGSSDTIYVELNLLNIPVRRRCTNCSFSDDPDGKVAVKIQDPN